MSEPATPTTRSTPPPASAPAVDASCRSAVLSLLVPAAFWLVWSSVAGLAASIKMHGPGFLAESAWLSFGRLQPASLTALIYGFLLPSALGTALWLVARLGRTPLRLGSLAVAGALMWHLGVAVGQCGLLAGDTTGHPLLEMPGYASPILLVGYLLAGTAAMVTYAARREPRLYVSQWFLLTALFWFPWIYATASVLLVASPVRGAFQAVVAAWYGANLGGLCLGFFALAALFYWVPKELNRPLHSEYLAMAAFWMFLVFCGWVAIPTHLPVPAWIPSVSTVFTVFTVVPLLAVALNFRRTFHGEGARGNPVLRLAWWSVLALLVSGMMAIVLAVPSAARILAFTYFVPAQLLLGLYGFVGLALMASGLAIVPRLLGAELPSKRLVGVQVGAAVAGIFLYAGALAAGGWMQGRALNNPAIPFNDVLQVAMRGFRLGTLGELLILAANMAWLVNLVWALARHTRLAWAPAWAEVTRPQTTEAGQ